jgi:hypothetical protein
VGSWSPECLASQTNLASRNSAVRNDLPPVVHGRRLSPRHPHLRILRSGSKNSDQEPNPNPRCARVQIPEPLKPKYPLSSFFNSGGARRNSNITVTIAVDDVAHAQPITIEVERAASRADHIRPLVFIIPSKQRLPCRYPVDREGYR